jgi:hypothetical protein
MTAQETIHTVKQGIAGTGASAAGIGMSFMEQLEQWLQIASLSVGLLVGLITLYNLTVKKWRKK